MRGPLCPYHEHAPLTLAGWQAWDVAMACQRQVRIGGDGRVLGLDFSAVIMAAEAKGYDVAAVVDLLPAIEAGLLTALYRDDEDG